MIKLNVIALLALAVNLHGQNTSDSGKEDAPRSGIPSFDLLPNGSILRRVQLPRYRKDNTLQYVIKVNQLTVVSDQEIDGRDVDIKLYNEQGRVESTSTIKFANLNKQTELIRSVENFHFEHPKISIDSAGVLFSLPNRRGILFGPVKTEFKKIKSLVNLTPKPKTLIPAMALSASIALTPSALLAEPAPASNEEIANLEDKAKPSATLDFEESTDTIVKRSKKEALAADEALNKFLAKNQLNKKAQPTNNAPPTDIEKKEDQPVQATPPATEKTKIQSIITATCDGGMFFDAEKGLFVYRDNIKLSDASFSLTCSDELKIFLTPKKSTKKKKAEGEISAPAFGDMKEAIATGNIEIRIKDTKKNGPDIIATAEEAIFDRKTESFILRKGFPFVKQGNNSVRALKEGLSIRITQEGIAMDSFGNGNNWETKIEIPKDQ